MPKFDLVVELQYERPDGGEPVAPCYWQGEGEREPTEAECVRQHVAQAIPGVLPDDHGDEAATIKMFGIRQRNRAARGVPTRKQYELLRVLVNFTAVLVPHKREFGPLERRGWTVADPRWADKDPGRYLPPQRITSAGLRALADAMERYEGEGGDNAAR